MFKILLRLQKILNHFFLKLGSFLNMGLQKSCENLNRLRFVKPLVFRCSFILCLQRFDDNLESSKVFGNP